ncbi:MAG: hypothetical protein ACLFU4_08340 [Opitutales bacterium]
MPHRTAPVNGSDSKPAPALTMRMIHGWILALSIALSASTAVMGEEKETISGKSPFLPPGHGEKKEAPKPPPTPSQGPLSREIEFRSVVQFGDS